MHGHRYPNRYRYRYVQTLEKLVHCRIFPPFTLLTPPFPTFDVLLPPFPTCMRALTHLHTHTYRKAARLYTTHIACVYIALARIFDYVTKTNTYTHKCMHIYDQCLRYMYVIHEIQVCLCVCMCMHACMHMHIYTHIHTCVYVCTYVCICTFRFSGT